MALLFPAHMKTILTSFARIYITSARPYVVLHAYWLWRVSKLDLAIVQDGNFTFLLSFSFSFGGLGLKVLITGLGDVPVALGCGFGAAVLGAAEGIGMTWY